MSTALNTAITARLTGTEVLAGSARTAQLALIALLGNDSETDGAAVYRGNISVIEPKVYPCFIFRESGGRPDPRFTQQTGAVATVFYDFEAWSQSTEGSDLTDIWEQIERLLDVSRGIAGVPTMSAGVVKWMGRFAEPSLFYSQAYNAWAIIGRWAFEEVRY